MIEYKFVGPYGKTETSVLGKRGDGLHTGATSWTKFGGGNLSILGLDMVLSAKNIPMGRLTFIGCDRHPSGNIEIDRC